MTLCALTSCAGSKPTDTPAPTDDSCVADNCAYCSSSQGGCVTCDSGFYAFLSYGTMTTSKCFECQQLNCAPGGCSDGIGALPGLASCA